MPRIAVAFTSIGFSHGVFVLSLEGFWAMSEPLVKTQWKDWKKDEALAVSAFRLGLKQRAG